MLSKRLKRILPLTVATAALWLVAPALSLSPYVPEAVDFESRLPAAERVAAPATLSSGTGEADDHGSWQTPEITAPQRFDLVGIAGEMRSVEIRTRRDGEAWSEWVETADGSPVWAGGADFLQVRADGFQPRGSLHYVNVSGSTTLAERIVTGARKTVNSAVAGVAGAFGSRAFAGTDVPRPKVVRRSRWGADESCVPAEEPQFGRKLKAAAVHHTVSTNDYTEEEAPAVVLGICRYHVNGNGWNDIGYNFLVDRYGNVYEGRDGGKRRAVVGAHAQGYNSLTTGIAVIGTHSDEEITPETFRALKKLLAWKLTLHGIDNARGRTRLKSAGGEVNRYSTGTKVQMRRIFSHRDANFTECAGDALSAEIGRLRRATQRLIDRYYPPQA